MRILRGRPLSLTADGVHWADDTGDEAFVEADGFVIADRRAPVRLDGLDRLPVAVVTVGDAREPRDITSPSPRAARPSMASQTTRIGRATRRSSPKAVPASA